MRKLAMLTMAVVTPVAACGTDTGPTGPNTVAVTSNQFTPPSLSVATNVAVTWRFQGGTHDVTFEDGTSNSGRNQSSGSHSRTFGAAGSYRYRCTIHSIDFTSGMIGTVVVQ